MVHYLTRRILIGSVTLLMITFVVYGLIRNMPGTPLTLDQETGDPSRQISQADLDRLKVLYGLDKPWYEAYFQWLGNAARLEFGRSIHEKRPVTHLIRERIGTTLLLEGAALLLIYALSVPLGLYASVRNGRLDERAMSVFLYMLYSLPSMVAALLLLNLFAVRLEGTAWELPLRGIQSFDYDELSFGGKIADVAEHMLLPVVCSAYVSLAYYSRFVKANMAEVIRQDYIRTAKAKGVGPWRIIVHHAFRNTLIPFVTLLGLTLPHLLSGAVIIEQIFTLPGMGNLFFESIGRRDYPTIMALTLLFSLMTLAGQLLADVLYAVVDPRITYS